VRTIYEAWAEFFGSRPEDGREDATNKHGILALGVRENFALVLVCTLRYVREEGCDRQPRLVSSRLIFFPSSRAATR